MAALNAFSCWEEARQAGENAEINFCDSKGLNMPTMRTTWYVNSSAVYCSSDAYRLGGIKWGWSWRASWAVHGWSLGAWWLGFGEVGPEHWWSPGLVLVMMVMSLVRERDERLNTQTCSFVWARNDLRFACPYFIPGPMLLFPSRLLSIFVTFNIICNISAITDWLKYSGGSNTERSKSERFKIWISNGSDFEWSIPIQPLLERTIQKLNFPKWPL